MSITYGRQTSFLQSGYKYVYINRLYTGVRSQYNTIRGYFNHMQYIMSLPINYIKGFGHIYDIYMNIDARYSYMFFELILPRNMYARYVIQKVLNPYILYISISAIPTSLKVIVPKTIYK